MFVKIGVSLFCFNTYDDEILLTHLHLDSWECVHSATHSPNSRAAYPFITCPCRVPSPYCGAAGPTTTSPWIKPSATATSCSSPSHDCIRARGCPEAQLTGTRPWTQHPQAGAVILADVTYSQWLKRLKVSQQEEAAGFGGCSLSLADSEQYYVTLETLERS